jgi:hypothetical protein
MNDNQKQKAKETPKANTDEDREDIGLLLMMKEVDRNIKVSPKTIMRKLIIKE